MIKPLIPKPGIARLKAPIQEASAVSATYANQHFRAF